MKTETRLKGMETQWPSQAGAAHRTLDSFENRDPLKGDGNADQVGTGQDNLMGQFFENRDPLKGDGNA